MLTRRGIITGIGALIVAPAIVRIDSIMPVKPLDISSALAKVWERYCVGVTPMGKPVWFSRRIMACELTDGTRLANSSKLLIKSVYGDWRSPFGLPLYNTVGWVNRCENDFIREVESKVACHPAGMIEQPLTIQAMA